MNPAVTKLDARLSRCWSIGLLALIATTWRLWFPSGSPDYPVVPWADISGVTFSMIGSIASGCLIAALFWLLLGKRRPSVAWWIVALSLVIGFFIDQHRLQPWAYQSAIYAIVFATMHPAQARRWILPLAASIYIYSAVGKFDFQFMHTVGQDFLNALLSPVGGLPRDWPIETRARIALVMPAGEFLVGLTLLVPWTRRVAGIAAMFLHGTLIAILGPWSLGHSNGVLLWNVLLMAQAWILFVGGDFVGGGNVAGRNVGWDKESSTQSRQPARQNAGTSKTRPSLQLFPSLQLRQLMAKAIIVIAVVMPIFERRGYWDHWLSWSLYSPHTSRVDVELFEADITELPPSIRANVETSDSGDRWRTLSLSAWSLEARGVPVYPQARYQTELVRRLCEQQAIESGVRVYVKGVSDRWTGKRDEVWLKGVSQLDR